MILVLLLRQHLLLIAAVQRSEIGPAQLLWSERIAMDQVHDLDVVLESAFARGKGRAPFSGYSGLVLAGDGMLQGASYRLPGLSTLLHLSVVLEKMQRKASDVQLVTELSIPGLALSLPDFSSGLVPIRGGANWTSLNKVVVLSLDGTCRTGLFSNGRYEPTLQHRLSIPDLLQFRLDSAALLRALLEAQAPLEIGSVLSEQGLLALYKASGTTVGLTHGINLLSSHPVIADFYSGYLGRMVRDQILTYRPDAVLIIGSLLAFYPKFAKAADGVLTKTFGQTLAGTDETQTLIDSVPLLMHNNSAIALLAAATGANAS